MVKRGSITIFLALSLTCFFSAVFAFLEAARVSGIKANTELSSSQAVDGVLASYHRELWEKYHLLFWQIPEEDQPELDTLKSFQQSVIEGNCRNVEGAADNYYLLQVHMEDVGILSYQLATDMDGEAFYSQAAESMKNTVAPDALDVVLHWMDDWKQQPTGDLNLDNTALEVLEKLNTSGNDVAGKTESPKVDLISQEDGANTDENAGSKEVKGKISMTENPLEWVKKVKKNGIYAFLMPEEELSEKSIDLSTCIHERVLQCGNMTIYSSDDMTKKLLFRMYLQKYFTNVSDEEQNHTLDYEMEYLIVGKAKDSTNLKGVVRKILAMREAANLAFLETNEKRQQEAGIISIALVSAIGQPELELMVRHGILAAWAFAESLNDVKILLHGGKVSLVKTEEQWHTDIFHLSSSVSVEGENQEAGLSYENYLQLLLWMIPNDKLSCRGLDIIEKNINIKMDSMLTSAQCEYIYGTESLFWNFVTLGNHFMNGYQFQNQRMISFN